MKKQEVYVEVRTKKQAKKLKEVLDMFGEKYFDELGGILEWTKIHKCVYFSNKERMWHGVSDIDLVSSQHDKVSIKQLRNILASEHLKEGDIIVCENDVDIAVGVFEEYEPEFGFVLNYKSIGGCFINFVRYATDEEKNLFKTELTPDDYKDLTWYKSTDSEDLFFLDKNKDTPNYGFYKGEEWIYGLNWFKNFNRNYFYKKGEWIEATQEEVKQVLITEAKRRGLVEGVKIKSKWCTGGVSEGYLGCDYHYNESHNELTIQGAYTLFKDGEWATVIEETLEQRVVKYAESVDWDFEKVVLYMNSRDKAIGIFNKHNPHWEVKKAFKEGKEVEYKSNINGQWSRATSPTWSDILEYRVKPEDSSEVVNHSDKIINDWVEELKTIQKEVKSNTLNRTDIISKGIGIYIPLVWVRLY